MTRARAGPGPFADVDPVLEVGSRRSGWVGGRTGLPGTGWSDAGLVGCVGGRTDGRHSTIYVHSIFCHCTGPQSVYLAQLRDTWSDASWPGWVVGRACSTRVRQKFRGAARRGHDVVGRVLARVGGWSDAGPPSRGGWVVGRDGYLKYRVHLGPGQRPNGTGPRPQHGGRGGGGRARRQYAFSFLFVGVCPVIMNNPPKHTHLPPI